MPTKLKFKTYDKPEESKSFKAKSARKATKRSKQLQSPTFKQKDDSSSPIDATQWSRNGSSGKYAKVLGGFSG